MQSSILFLCPHNAAKGVIAAAYFNQLAQRVGLSMMANSAGTEPAEAVSPVVVDMLKREGIDVSQHQPRLVTSAELQTSARVISMGCTLEELGNTPKDFESWTDVPMVSQEPERAREVIYSHVSQLIDELRADEL